MNRNQLPQNNHNPNSVVVHREERSFSGPLPHPEILRQFEQVVPGAAERIIKMAEDQSSHRRDLEKKVIDSDIERSKWGQILGFVLALVGLSVSGVVAVIGNPWAGTVIGVGTIASLVSVFMYGTNSRRQERQEKEESKPQDN